MVPLEPSRSHAHPFSRDHPGAQHVALVPQLLEIFLSLEQGPEARVWLYFFPLSLENLGKDTFKASLTLLSPCFPHGARQQNNAEIKKLDLKIPSSPKECLECWKGCDIFSTPRLDSSLLFLTLCRFAPGGGKNLWILLLFPVSLSVSLGMGGGGTPSSLSCWESGWEVL